MPSRRADPRHGTPTGPPPPSQTDPRQQRWSRLAAWYVASRHLPCNGPNPPPPPPWSRLVRTHVREEGETGASPERYASQRTQTVQLNALSHIAVDRHFYSVPYQYVGKEVDVRVRGSVIDVFHRGRQIASHRVWSSVTDQSPPPGVAMSGLVEVCNRNVHTGRWTTRPGCAGSALPAGKMTRFGLACRRQIRPLPWPDIPLGLPRHESQAASVFTGYDRQVWQQSQLRELSTALAPPFRRLRISIAQLAVTWAMTAAA